MVEHNLMGEDTKEKREFQKRVSGKVRKFSADLSMMKVNGNELMSVVIVKEANKDKNGKCEGHRVCIQASNGTAIEFAESIITFLVELDLPAESVIEAFLKATLNRLARKVTEK